LLDSLLQEFQNSTFKINHCQEIVMEEEEELTDNAAGDDNLTESLKALSLQQQSEVKDIKIVCDDLTLVCDSVTLRQKSKYFDAFLNFEDSLEAIEIKGGIDKLVCKTIIDYFNGEDLAVNVDNFQDLLLGSIFLQSSCTEEYITNFIINKLEIDNVFRLYAFSKEVGSKDVQTACKNYIEKNFSSLLKLATQSSQIEEFLESSVECLTELLDKDLQIAEAHIYFSIIGWIEHNKSQRLPGCGVLLEKLVWPLISPHQRDYLADEPRFQTVIEHLSKTINTPRRRDCKIVSTSTRWPRMIIAYGTGGSKGRIQYLDLSQERPFTWKILTKKPKDQRQNCAGSALLFVFPRLYLMMGESRSKMTWYDVEADKWGETEGAAPSRLLAGTAVLNDKILIIGGVSVEEWERGTKEVVTSTSVDVYDPVTDLWTSLTMLPQGVSNPAVGVWQGQVYVFGGLQQRRRVVRSCYRYSDDGSWKPLAPLPQPLCYPALVIDPHRAGIWLLGGMDSTSYTACTQCYLYRPDQDSWTTGPSLLAPRRSGFAFECNGDIYVSAGLTDGLKTVDTTEVLAYKSDCWQNVKALAKTWNNPVSCVKVGQPDRLITKVG